MTEYTIPCKAIVSYSRDDWQLHDVLLRAPRTGEVLVQTYATGICHSDVANVGGIFPRILGRSGIVASVHDSVHRCAVGDHVLLSFPRCQQCDMCLRGHPAHCDLNGALTIAAREPNYALAEGEDPRLLGDDQGRRRVIPASYFGQSSFSSVALVKETCVVKVDELILDRRELGLFAPIGCGIHTGACAVTNVARPGPNDHVAVLGLGAVGLAALMAARYTHVQSITAVDVVPSRLEVAKSLGATYTLDSTTLGPRRPLSAAIRALPPFTPSTDAAARPRGPSIIIDTTGIPSVINEALKAVAHLGKVVQIANAGPGSSLTIDLPAHMAAGASLIGTIQGDADPYESIPRLIGWYRRGALPLEKLATMFPAEEWREALRALESGAVVKAVLVW